MKNYFTIAALSALCLLGGSCTKEPRQGGKTPLVVKDSKYYVNYFAFNAMNTYYLWVDEVEQKMKCWNSADDPIQKVQSVRYKDENGKDIDKWTTLTDDMASLQSSVAGVATTYGCGLSLYYYDESRTSACLVVRYSSLGTPAQKAGLKRGDVIYKISGKTIPANNFNSLIYGEFLEAPSCSLTLTDGREIEMTAVEMYEDPVLLYKSFDCSGEKVGYLFYNQFTLDSYSRLIEACEALKAEGVSQLILDMRYNPGGYVLAEYTLASLLAPWNVVDNQALFEKAIYNSHLADVMKDQSETHFQNEFKFSVGNKSYDYNTANANLNLTKVYAILTGNSASASESVLVGLKPYMDVEIIGEQSGGKYCSGILYPAEEWYSDYSEQIGRVEAQNGKKMASNWGIYVMISRYADCNGQTPCMPDGFVPDTEVEDDPTETYPLGDERELMLNTALLRAGKTDLLPREEPLATKGSAKLVRSSVSIDNKPEVRILLPEQLER